MKCKMCRANVSFEYWARHQRKCKFCFDVLNELVLVVGGK